MFAVGWFVEPFFAAENRNNFQLFQTSSGFFFLEAHSTR
jgi:hypothetical protein